MDETKTPVTLPASIDYPPGLAIEIAVVELFKESEPDSTKIDVDREIEHKLKQFDLTIADYDKIKISPNFRADVVANKQSIKSDGGTIKRKAEFLFDHYLGSYVPEAMDNDNVSAKDKNFLLEFLGKVSGRYNQKSEVVQAVEAASKIAQPSIVINMPAGFDATKLIQNAEKVD
jgi:hypothetical protein